MKLVQKRLFKDTREFEIGNDAVYVRIKGLIKEEKLTVSLSALEPEPVAGEAVLEFHGKAQRGPLLTFIQNNPNVEEFDAFIVALRQKILDAMTGAAGENGNESFVAAPHQAPGWNVYDEPPDFDDEEKGTTFAPVNPDRLKDDVAMLREYLDQQTIQPFIDSIEKLIREPDDEATFDEMVAAFNDLGANQGAVLTYTTYLKILLSKTIWS